MQLGRPSPAGLAGTTAPDSMGLRLPSSRRTACTRKRSGRPARAWNDRGARIAGRQRSAAASSRRLRRQSVCQARNTLSVQLLTNSDDFSHVRMTGTSRILRAFASLLIPSTLEYLSLRHAIAGLPASCENALNLQRMPKPVAIGEPVRSAQCDDAVIGAEIPRRRIFLLEDIINLERAGHQSPTPRIASPLPPPPATSAPSDHRFWLGF